MQIKFKIGLMLSLSLNILKLLAAKLNKVLDISALSEVTLWNPPSNSLYATQYICY